MQSTDQLLSRIDSLLLTQERKATDLHLRVMDLLDNPTQCARIMEWDTESHEITDRDRVELNWLEERATVAFKSDYWRDRMAMHSLCVSCELSPAATDYDNLFCSPYCAEQTSDDSESPPTPLLRKFTSFYKANLDLPKPLHYSNVCVAPMYLLKHLHGT